LKLALPLAAAMNIFGVPRRSSQRAPSSAASEKKTRRKSSRAMAGMLDRIDSLLFNAPLIYYFALAYFR
jgi:hypothetical protein